MQVINRAFSWWSETFRKQGIVGKALFGGMSLLILCCVCTIPIGILSPPTPTPTSAPTEIASNPIAAQFEQPTATIPPTNILEPTATETAVPLSTPTGNQTALGATCIPNNPPQTGKVVDVVDGDTIRVLLDQDGLVYSVRYIGMDTPENTSQVEYFGAEATAKNLELVGGKTVTLIKDVSETDIYGRLLRYVLVDNIFVNYELVAQGYANTASFPPDVSCIPIFLDAEQKASTAKLGLWAAPPTLVAAPTSSGGGGNAPCNCSGPDLDCGNFSSHASAQACYNHCVSAGLGDVFRLDSDGNGLACESLP